MSLAPWRIYMQIAGLINGRAALLWQGKAGNYTIHLSIHGSLGLHARGELHCDCDPELLHLTSLNQVLMLVHILHFLQCFPYIIV
uniref:Uncharacterized protein n=1 Tax=Arundo donax TaxID=35708 RepID=A0A0A8XXI5_ARUDO